MTQSHAGFTRGNIAGFGHRHRFHPMFSKRKIVELFYQRPKTVCRFLIFSTWKKNFEVRRDQRAFLLLFTGRRSARSPHDRTGSAPQESASVTSGNSNAEGSAGFPPAVPQRSFSSGSGPSVSPPPLHFPVRRTAGRSLELNNCCGTVGNIMNKPPRRF